MTSQPVVDMGTHFPELFQEDAIGLLSDEPEMMNQSIVAKGGLGRYLRGVTLCLRKGRRDADTDIKDAIREANQHIDHQ